MATTQKKTWNVQKLSHCSICGKKIESPSRYRTYCSSKCRNRRNYLKYHGGSKELREKNNRLQSEAREKKNREKGKEMVQCKICNRWFRQVGSHVWQKHKISAREYREYIGVDVKKGLLPEDLRQLYGEQALENGTYLNLRNGSKYWFKTGDPKAGRYKRSEQTMERLREHIKTLHNKNRKY